MQFIIPRCAVEKKGYRRNCKVDRIIFMFALCMGTVIQFLVRINERKKEKKKKKMKKKIKNPIVLAINIETYTKI